VAGNTVSGAGVNAGYSSGSSSSYQDQYGASTFTPTYTGQQSTMQQLLAQVFSSLLPAAQSGGLSPNVQALATANANSINQNYQSLTDRTNRYLAQRGFGQSGLVGQNALQTEIARQGSLAANLSNASGQQLTQNNTLLSDALNFAFMNPGNAQNYFQTTLGNTSSSGWGIGVGSGYATGPGN
jgi:hypothetical protein